MKKIRIKSFVVSLLMLVFWSSDTNAQNDYNPVSWNVQLLESKSEIIVVEAKATIDEGWHLYAFEVSNDPDVMGPLPLEFNLNVDNIELVDKPVEKSKMITHYDKSFEVDLNYFEKELIINQKVKVSSLTKNISGNIVYMVCDDEKCMFPPEYNFEIKLNHK